MDQLDINLLELLQMDGRMTVSELSKKLALSRPSISERLHRLQEKGIIEGFSARVSPAAVGRGVLLFIQVSEPKVSAHEFEQVVRQDSDIIECHRVTGVGSHFLKAAVADMESMRLLIDRLMPYGHLNTSIVLLSPVPYRHILPKIKESE
ncbi:Lrp/AsnC family transcriptional regulator [Ectobacillus panaciterrae]|uniref:Lrp/AsnC family transcriptional regulator n=1 Tax=Ectobacillus panaciterrae TaxID=363872 RepID=UPI0004280E9D|nr:Lrp/AsnC family transcriptional regulator [Ectobacillus panaciterrae]